MINKLIEGLKEEKRVTEKNNEELLNLLRGNDLLTTEDEDQIFFWVNENNRLIKSMINSLDKGDFMTAWETNKLLDISVARCHSELGSIISRNKLK